MPKPKQTPFSHNACSSLLRISALYKTSLLQPTALTFFLLLPSHARFLLLLPPLLAMAAQSALVLSNHSSSSSSSPRKHVVPPRSPLVVFSSLNNIIDGAFSKKSPSIYSRLRSEPLRLSVLKLDGSTFDIRVAKTATIAELKEAVEAVFSQMPQKGPGKISWPHVWGQFCFCYDGQKLVTDDDYLRNYGIKDGDQLRFIRHVSNRCNLQGIRLKKRVVHFKQHRRSSSQVNCYQLKELSDDDDDDEIGSDDVAIGDGKIDKHNEEEHHVRKNKLTGFVGELFSYNRLAVLPKTRTKSRMFCPSMVGRCLLGNFRKIRRIICFGRRRRYPWRHTL